MTNKPAADEAQRLMPWETGPTGHGAAQCGWCGRDIHAPALPCSMTNGMGLAAARTKPGLGERCKWELRVRGLDADQRPA